MRPGQIRDCETVMQPAEPQAILSPITEAAIFVTVTVEPGGEARVLDLLSDVSGLKRSVGFRIPEGQLTCVVGIGASVWDPGCVPSGRTEQQRRSFADVHARAPRGAP